MKRPQSSDERGGITAVMLACCAIGAVTVGATLVVERGNLNLERTSAKSARVPSYATEEYGKRLLSQTTEYLGPDVPDPKMRYTGSRMNCGSCHLATGNEPGTLTLLLVKVHYPKMSGRTNTSIAIEDRINECMQRSLNGRPLPMDSPEMFAMASYLRELGARVQAMGASQQKPTEPASFKTPNRKADFEAGKKVFDERCAACHGSDGLGLMASANPVHGYVFPPLWGPDSFNEGAGMHRVITASQFIKARMPLGKPDLTDDEAFDVAAFINTKPRPEMANLDRDYPDRTKKNIDTGYGPFADPFPLEQHQFGPFPPIEAYYKQLQKKPK